MSFWKEKWKWFRANMMHIQRLLYKLQRFLGNISRMNVLNNVWDITYYLIITFHVYLYRYHMHDVWVHYYTLLVSNTCMRIVWRYQRGNQNPDFDDILFTFGLAKTYYFLWTFIAKTWKRQTLTWRPSFAL